MTLIRFFLHTLFSSFQTNIMELDFLEKKIVGTTNVDRSSPTFTFLLPTQKDTLFKIPNREIVDPENHTGPVQLHMPCIRLGPIKECPSPLGIHKPSQAHLLPQLSCTSYNSCTTLYVFFE